jgi:hypothetical protein
MSGHAEMVLLDIFMMHPIGRDGWGRRRRRPRTRTALLYQAAGEQAAPAVIVGDRVAHSVGRLHVRRFPRDVEHGGRLRLPF